ncbi:MAG: hypothetical protein ACYDEQ_10465 [Desulfocucumaceae bacterium]
MKKMGILLTGLVLSLTVALFVFLGVSFWAGATGRSIMPVFGQSAEMVVSPGAVLREENSYLCGDVELVFQGQAPAEIVGKDIKGLRAKYIEKEGWSVSMENEKAVVLKKSVEAFCGDHSRYRHLGLYRERLAIFQGPLGYDWMLLRVEEKKRMDQLPGYMQEKLKKAQEFSKLTPEEKTALRADLEFTDENLLNSVLENLDEAM